MGWAGPGPGRPRPKVIKGARGRVGGWGGRHLEMLRERDEVHALLLVEVEGDLLPQLLHHVLSDRLAQLHGLLQQPRVAHPAVQPLHLHTPIVAVVQPASRRVEQLAVARLDVAMHVHVARGGGLPVIVAEDAAQPEWERPIPG